jgi:hypothetical protein
MLDRSQISGASEEVRSGAETHEATAAQDAAASTSRYLTEAEVAKLESAEKALQSLLADQQDPATSPFD